MNKSTSKIVYINIDLFQLKKEGNAEVRPNLCYQFEIQN